MPYKSNLPKSNKKCKYCDLLALEQKISKFIKFGNIAQ